MAVVVGPAATAPPGVCDVWTTVAAVRAANPKLTDPPYTDEIVERAIRWASDMLFELTGRQWPGTCTAVWRPPDRGCWPSWRDNPSVLDLGQLYRALDITQVVIDGAVVDPATYELRGGRWLVRLANGTTPRPWPTVNRVDLPLTAQHTWAVTFTYGGLPPQGGTESASIYAAELALAMAGSSDCRLPKGTQQVARQGVTLVVYPRELLASGGTGLSEVDAWVTSVNPNRIRQRATVLTPDSAYF